MRFLLSTGWLIGAGGGWALALAGLSAGARGVNPIVDLIIVGGAASWVGMLWTALRPGRSPNLLQVVLAGASWLMPLTMLILREEFSANFIMLAFASAICVTLIVVIYPSQSYAPTQVSDRRLEMHVVQALKDAKPRPEEREIEQQQSNSQNSTRGEDGPLDLAASVLAGAGLGPAERPAVGEISDLIAGRSGLRNADEKDSVGPIVRRDKFVARGQEDLRSAESEDLLETVTSQQVAVETLVVQSTDTKQSKFVVQPATMHPAGNVQLAASKWITPTPARKGTVGSSSANGLDGSSEVGTQGGDGS